ncbi:MAG TPA: serine hydrolase domain-containing protein [Ilumatobacteraceae bacterium]|nr:serine hydrolase domain-containing protein [Ilumatobacteraceae bacterium]HRB01914.1 serine hydrolase domain-containing protein [Ilumatobacteraceae bacterium]
MNEISIRRLEQVMHEHVDSGVLPSCSAAIAHNDEVLWAATAGPVSPTTRFAIFSAGKALVAAAVWRFVDDGVLTFDNRVRDVLPEFGRDGATSAEMGRVTIAHLLAHSGGFSTAHLHPDKWGDAAQRRNAYASWSCLSEPGTEFAYHPVAAHWVLADILECLAGVPFASVLHAHVTEPLGLSSAFASTPLGEMRRPIVVGAVPTDEAWRRSGMEPPQPEPAELAQPVDIVSLLSTDWAFIHGVPGGGGVTTPSELALFYQALLGADRGPWSANVLRKGTAEVVDNRHVVPFTSYPSNRTMGLILAGDDGFARFRGFGGSEVSPRVFGHDGAGGQLAFADPDTGLSFVFATDGHDLDFIRRSRRSGQLADAALSCL